MKKLLKSTTSLTLCMALVVPGLTPVSAAAQATDGAAQVQDTAPQDSTAEADLLEQALKQEWEAAAAAEEAAQTAADSTAAADQETAAAAAQAAADAEATAQAAAASADAASADAAAAAAAAAEADAAAQADADAAAQAEADAAAQAEADAAAQAEADAAAQVEADAAAQAEADAAAQNEADAAAQAEADAAAQTEADAAAQTEADAAAQTEADAAAQNDADAAAQAEADAAALEQSLRDAQTTDAEPEVAPEAQSQTETPAPTEEATETAPAETPTDAPAETEQTTAPTQAETDALNAQAEAEAAQIEARSAEREAELEAARQALEAAPTGEVITEEVAPDSTRRSDEDFETTATGTPAAQEDGGLSNLEKALLLGLGAAVVGTVLSNGNRVLSNSGDRVVVEDERGQLRVLKDDDALLRRAGDEVRTEQFNDGSTRQTIERPDGSRIVTIRGGDGTVLRRISMDSRGNETVLFDDFAQEQRVVVSELPRYTERSFMAQDRSEEELRAALVAQQRTGDVRNFSLRQIREIGEVRALAPQIELDAVRFASGSAAIAPEQARSLTRVGDAMLDLIAQDPRTVFLIEGHTDAVGSATFNLALSDRRAETVALALTEYFDVPPANMITQGYGESALKVQTQLDEQANRRAVVRNITTLLQQASN